VIFDGIVLAGGRSTRLDGVAKATLEFEGTTLLSRTVAALAGAERVVVVGDPADAPRGVTVTREDPPFGGPAAAIAAGLAALGPGAEHVVVLACDMPHADRVVAALLRTDGTDAVLAVDADGRMQYLAARYRTAVLRESLARHGGSLHGLPARLLLDGLATTTTVVGDGSTRDIDTWEDAAHFGISHPNTSPEEPS